MFTDLQLRQFDIVVFKIRCTSIKSIRYCSTYTTLAQMDDQVNGLNVKGTINVLVIGESQEGKSTLIKQLSKYSNRPGLDIKTGDGNVACTKEVREYALSIRPQDFKLVDPEGKDIVGRSYPELCDLTPQEARVVEVEVPNTKSINYNFIDTPGLDDSEGDDFSHMAKIIGRLSQTSHLNALVYVRSVEKPFGRSFEQFFRYFQRCLPSISNGFIIIHSYFTTTKVDESLAEEVDLMVLRRDAFKNAIDLTLEHFFMDNDPSTKSPFAVQQSSDEINRLLFYLASQRQVESSHFKLLKTSAMRNTDVHILNFLRQLLSRKEREYNKERMTADKFSHQAFAAEQEILRLKSKMSAKQDRVDELESMKAVKLGSVSPAMEYGVWKDLLMKGRTQLDALPAEYNCPYTITEVDSSSSRSSLISSILAEWRIFFAFAQATISSLVKNAGTWTMLFSITGLRMRLRRLRGCLSANAMIRRGNVSSLSTCSESRQGG